MSGHNQVAKELVEILKAGERGFARAAEKLQDGDHPEWVTTLQRFSEQRAQFDRKIVALGHDCGEDVDESGTTAATVHRGWITLKDALSGDPTAVLKARRRVRTTPCPSTTRHCSRT